MFTKVNKRVLKGFEAMRGELRVLKIQNKQLIEANRKLQLEAEKWRDLYLAEVNKKLGGK